MPELMYARNCKSMLLIWQPTDPTIPDTCAGKTSAATPTLADIKTVSVVGVRNTCPVDFVFVVAGVLGVCG